VTENHITNAYLLWVVLVYKKNDIIKSGLEK